MEINDTQEYTVTESMNYLELSHSAVTILFKKYNILKKKNKYYATGAQLKMLRKRQNQNTKYFMTTTTRINRAIE